MLEVITETGAKYHLDIENNFWKKFARDGYEYAWEKIWGLKHSADTTYAPWSVDHPWPDGIPEVGEHLYIACRYHWWVSTPVVSIEEIEGGIDG
jgi:hypothetical protein